MPVSINLPLTANDTIDISRKVPSYRDGINHNIGMIFRLDKIAVTLETLGDSSKLFSVENVVNKQINVNFFAQFRFNRRIVKGSIYPKFYLGGDTLYSDVFSFIESSIKEIGLVSEDSDSFIEINTDWACKHIDDFLKAYFI